jgi:hypothetical protein
VAEPEILRPWLGFHVVHAREEVMSQQRAARNQTKNRQTIKEFALITWCAFEVAIARSENFVAV